MTATVDFLPIWKKDATASERLSELSMLAAKYPERFEQFVICYKETLSNGNWKFRSFEHNCKLLEGIGLYEIGKVQYLKDTEK